jgi:SAM-dependent methyltransferase
MTLVDQYKEMHKDENFYAVSVLSLHKESIRQFLAVNKCETILDYGCGKANQYHKENIHNDYFFGIMPSLYDPAVKEYSKLPQETFDAVISTDVLEHIEEDDLDKVLKQIYSKADKFVYLGICNSPAHAILPDGRNAHVTLQSFDWWVDKIVPHAKTFTLIYVYGNGGGKAIINDGVLTLNSKR